MKKVHKEEMEEDGSSDSTINDQEEEEEEEEVEQVGEEEGKEEVEEGSDADDDDFTKESAWDFIVRQAAEKLTFDGIEDAKDILESDDVVKNLIVMMAETIGNWQDALSVLASESDTYYKLRKSIDRLIAKEDYGEKDAIVKVFKDRKNLLHKVVHKREHLLQEVLDEQESDDENESDHDSTKSMEDDPVLASTFDG
ncbi:MAG: hypothetical protein GY739_13070 [Mesoflavibacter sp.]|nr:hypothetical protein [Mesoflavibacter sp.]